MAMNARDAADDFDIPARRVAELGRGSQSRRTPEKRVSPWLELFLVEWQHGPRRTILDDIPASAPRQ
jgi:hypothetical protein